MQKSFTILFLAGLLATASVQAAFNLLDDFESLTTGELDGQGAWSGSTGAFTVTDLSGNQVAEYTTFSPQSGSPRFLENTTNLNVGTTGESTFFLRIQMPGFTTGTDLQALNNQVIRDAAAPDTFGGSRNQFSLQGATPNDATVRLHARDGSTDTVLVDPAAADTWYYVWVVSDATNQNWDLYANTTGATATASDLVGNDLAWRDTTNSGVVNFILGNTTLNDVNQGAYVDDIYYDLTGANLANPIPEPSTYALLAGLATLAVVMYRRRR